MENTKIYKQGDLMEYKSLGHYLEVMRRGKKIPYRVFEENGISVSTFQRVIKEEADIRISDLAIITEILCLSPLEVNMEAEKASFTVSYRKNFMEALESGEFEKAQKIYEQFKEYYLTTSFTLGKLSVLYMFQALLLLYYPQTYVSEEEVLFTENRILKRLDEAEVYTLFDIEFLALQYRLNIQNVSFSLVSRVLKQVDITMIDFRTKQVFDEFFLNLTLGVLKKNSIKDFLDFEILVQTYEVTSSDWFLSTLKKTLIILKMGIIYKNKEKMYSQLNKQKEALSLILSEEGYRRIKKFFDQLIQISLMN